PGQVMPSGSVHTIQHLEGGVVAEVLVQNNSIVEVNQVLFRMDGTQNNAELEQIDANIAGLNARIIRTRAFAMDQKPDFSSIPARFKNLADTQQKIYDEQVLSLETNKAVIRAQTAQRQSELQSLNNALKTARDQVVLTTNMLGIRKTLMDKEAITRLVYLETQKANETALGEVKRLNKQIENIQGAIDESNSRIKQLSADAQRAANDELTLATNELAQVNEQRIAAADRVARLEVRSPVHGIAQEVNITSNVIPPGGILAKIVPTNDKLQVEVHISPQDVGRIRFESPATIKLTSYTNRFFDRVFGVLTSVSPSTLLDEKQQAYFKGIVTLEKNYLGNSPGMSPILPGMLAQVDITLDERRVIDLIWQPVYNIIHDAFKEH
ncbi:MAG: HlyD family type I secretion periplasmic adaptor subunit, partial [Magnetococcales bacterium]|nr:HlyD family type I secretion periplasmic adaptor subunit [Magnetococcales bacterium]